MESANLNSTDPTSLWWDIVIGADRTFAEFQSKLSPAVGLDQSHFWFLGNDEDYWDSDIKYQCPQQYEQSRGGDPVFHTERLEHAGEVTIDEMARQLKLEQYDRICDLYDYGDEWRFYAILKDVFDDESSNTKPDIVNEKGESIDQYGSSRERRF